MSDDNNESGNVGSSSDQYIEMIGSVDSIVRDRFLVTVPGEVNDMKVLCTPSGKIRISGVKVLPGDQVRILVSAYDVSKGRIIYRMKN